MNKVIKGALLAVGLVSTVVRADTSTITAAPAAATMGGSSSTTVAPSLLDHFTSSYVGIYTGGSLSKPGQSFSPDTDGNPDPTMPQQMENLLGVFYKLSPTAKVGAQAHFFYSPVDNKNITMMDPLLQINDSALIVSGNFKLGGYTRAYLPATAESTDKGRILQMRFFLNPNYDVPGTRISLGAYSYAQPAAFKSSGTGTTFLGYLGPYVNYQLTPTVAISALYEMAASHKKNKDGFTDLDNAGTDFEPGVSWDITPNLTLNPYLNIYTGNRITSDNTSINLLIIGKLL